ncbi:hypothetical protein ABK040_006615 [Willaertia magna]
MLPKKSEVKNHIRNHPNFEKDLMYFKTLFIQDFHKFLNDASIKPNTKLKIFSQNTIIYNKNEGNPYIIYFKNAIPLKTMNKVFKIYDEYYTDKRDSVHFGVWGLYYKLLYNITEGQEGDNPLLEDKLHKTDFFKRGEKLLEMWLPHTYQHLQNVKEQLNLTKDFAGYSAMAINNCKSGTRASNLHYNTNDSAVSMLFCTGNFSDANLQFPELNISFEFNVGDVIFFKGNTLQHNKRFSIVFFIHRHLSYPNERLYYNLKKGESVTEYKKQGCPEVFKTKIKGKRNEKSDEDETDKDNEVNSTKKVKLNQ